MKQSKDAAIRNRMHERQTVLLVDDSENDTLLMRAAFGKADFNVSLHEVHNGDDAIAYLVGTGKYANREDYPLPSVVLLDLNMPQKNGFEVLGWARGRESLVGTSIVVMTASMRPEDVNKAFDLGASSYLIKPLNLDDLVKMVTCLEQWSRMNYFPPQNRIGTLTEA